MMALVEKLKNCHHFYVSQWTVINVNLLCVEFVDKILIFAVLEWWLLQLRENASSFVL